ncbi:MAG: glycosyltransferase family 4 protein, partial [Rhodospirillales bacterium]|nr:glycosyltransferase family 4 protein [Rhodospirillales bacterium]
PSRGELIERARRQGLGDAVTCLGVVPREDMAATIAAFDIAVQPRVVAYASPLKLFEYMALGKAVIAPDQANIREVLRHRAEALLFSPHDPHGLRRALSVLCREAPLRRRLGMAAALAVLQRGYSWDANAERIERLALSLTAAREGGIAQPLADAAE